MLLRLPYGSNKNAALKENWDCTNTALVAGIGCHGHMLNFIKITSFEGLHGRALPVASAIKMVKPDLSTFSALINKYGVDKVSKANQVELLYEQQQKDGKEEFTF